MTKALLTVAMIILATANPVNASRPLIQPPETIQISHLSQPRSLQSVMSTKTVGLDLESSDDRLLWLERARKYRSYRASPSRAQTAKWIKKCDATAKKSENAPDVFCTLEKQRIESPNAISRASVDRRSERREAVNAIREAHYDKLARATDQELIYAVDALGEPAAVIPFAQSITSSVDCVPSGLATAMGGRLEELFPAPDAVELTKSLYKKASSCGNNLAAGKAAFRLGLILVWQNKCGDVPTLMAKAESISDASQFHSRAKYWRYQCAVISGSTDIKKSAQEALHRDFPLSFQNLAINGDNDELMKHFTNEDDPDVSLRSTIRPDLNEVIRASEALVKIGSANLAAEILDRNVNEFSGLEPEVRLYVAVLLNRVGYSLPAFKILSSLFQDTPRMVTLSTMKIFFPLGYLNLANDKKAQIDPFLILSLIRQESAFNASARSIVGARGLMQVMPATARMIASVRKGQLFKPAVNVRVGTKYFLQRLHQFNGDVELTLAAYNAGVTRVDGWLKRYPMENRILFLDFIPFKETRDYVTSILRNYYWYTKLYSQIEAPASTAQVSKAQAIMRANAGLVAADRPATH